MLASDPTISQSTPQPQNTHQHRLQNAEIQAGACHRDDLKKDSTPFGAVQILVNQAALNDVLAIAGLDNPA